MGLLVWARREVNLRRKPSGAVPVIRAHISNTERPDTIDGQRLSACILQESLKSPGRQIVGRDEAAGLGVSAGKLSDEQIMAETSKIKGSENDAPRSVLASLHAQDASTVGRSS